jgi:hypothetical protein
MVSPLAFAQQEIASDAGEVVLDATVNAIDVENRLLTVTGPDGNTIVIKATPEILGRVKINDQITIRYADELATALRTINDAPPVNKANAIEREETGGMGMNAPTVAEQTWVEAAPQGETELNTVEVTATVANVEYGRRIVTFYGPNGTMRNVRIAPGVQGLDAIQRGDRVVMGYRCKASMNAVGGRLTRSPFSLLNDLRQKPQRLSTASKYTALNGIGYLAIGEF